MPGPLIERFGSRGVTLLGDRSRPCGVTVAFTERTGGASGGDVASLNLGDACGDDPALVAENRRRALAALGAEGCLGRLVCPRQVHGDRVVVVDDAGEAALGRVRAEAAEGADAVVCTVPGVPVLLCFADCAPVVLVAPGGFAVVHSGWRGTLARISAKAARVLCERTGADVADVWAYVGPHVGAGDYEVSEELIGRFRGEFGARIEPSSRHLDLASAIGCALEEAGVAPGRVAWVGGSTASETDRFFSYRASGGHCGRHGAIALMPGTD